MDLSGPGWIQETLVRKHLLRLQPPYSFMLQVCLTYCYHLNVTFMVWIHPEIYIFLFGFFFSLLEYWFLKYALVIS